MTASINLVLIGRAMEHLPIVVLAWRHALARRSGAGDAGFVRFADIAADDYLACYARVVGRGHPHLAAEQRLLAATPFLVETAGARPLTRYGLTLPAAAISL